MSALLEVAGLTAHYGDFQALFGIDLRLDEGETVAIIGANGAGKSTTIKMLTGILVPTSGHLRVAGLDPSTHRTALAHRIGEAKKRFKRAHPKVYRYGRIAIGLALELARE